MIEKRVFCLEKRIMRVEVVLWYLAGIVTIKFGSDALPLLMAVFPW